MLTQERNVAISWRLICLEVAGALMHVLIAYRVSNEQLSAYGDYWLHHTEANPKSATTGHKDQQ